MIKTDIAKELRRYTGKGTIRAKELAGFLGGEEYQPGERKVSERA